ncbi:response regulator [Paenibacillus mesophilus]|uniref:response regulator transcription factor n=1 Tax=Paenibacillus mesophilus TaxID=2582849 RepID=UPI00110E4809|nr:response regulator transcription factor [Paenibacillus mesophilus]TMV47720.1 response regulator [Paenibacillus mesophilus]
MSMQLLQEKMETAPLFYRLSRVLVESAETACGLIFAKCTLSEARLARLKEKISGPDPEAQFYYASNYGRLAILLPDKKLSYTHYVSLSVKQYLQDGNIPGGGLLITSFPECGVPKEADVQAMHDMIADEADNDNPILIYNQPEAKTKQSTILIIDEDATVGELLHSRLRMKGYEVYTADNGLDGLRLFKSLSPDLVITELSLPVYDGYELIRSIRGEKEQYVDCSIMVLSDKRMERDISACFEMGVADYMTKPYSPVELEARIRRLLQ